MCLTILSAVPTLAENSYEGVNPGTFGKPTSTEPVTEINNSITERDNINRSKDSAFIPPSFSSPSADMKGSGELLTPNISGMKPIYGGNPVAANNGSNSFISSNAEDTNTYYPTVPEDYKNSVNNSGVLFTSANGMFNSDGTLGTLKIPSIDLDVDIYEDESLESLKKGAGHFSFTSCWEGNVALAGHNRGIANHFGKIHTLEDGDKIVYKTNLGTKIYKVFYVGKIDETDYSRLQPTNENIITLITCVENQPSKRWCVQAKEA